MQRPRLHSYEWVPLPTRTAAQAENRLVLIAALGIDEESYKHPLGLVEEATENTAFVQDLIDNLIKCGIDPKVCRLFIIDGAKPLSKAIRATFGRYTDIRRS
jgi:transposase-like protein